MTATPPLSISLRSLLLASGLVAAFSLSACAPVGGGPPAAAAAADACGPGADCEDPGQLANQVRLDTDAILTGMAHARERLGLQEDAAP
jgi:hypothetical protein